MNGQQVVTGVRAGRGQRDIFKVVTQATDWQAAGLCAQPGARSDDWFDGFEYGGSMPDEDTPTKAARAKALCKGCPIIDRCAMFAFENKLEHGVYGGLTPTQRARIAARKLATAKKEAS